MYSQSVFGKDAVKGEDIVRAVTLINFYSKSKWELRNIIGELEEATMMFKEQGGWVIKGEQVHDMVHVHCEGMLEWMLQCVSFIVKK